MIIETIETDVASVGSANLLYNDYQKRWQYLLESYLGGEEYRKAGHLTRYQLETDAEYAARLRATPLENHCKSVVSVYNSFLFREQPEREFGVLEGTPELDQFLRDADFDGRSLDQFMKDVSTWSNVFGHCWIIMTKPNVGALTRADEIANGVRPYLSLITPMTMLDWSWKRTPAGKFELAAIKYVEEVNGNTRTIKQWTSEEIRTWTIDLNSEEVITDTVEINALGRVPAVIAYAGRSTVRGIGVSSISDIADAQKFIYNATSEVDQSIRLDSHPSLVLTPETQAGIGAGSVIRIPENLDPGLKPYILEFSGASVSAIYSAIEHMIAAIDKMANTGAVRATESKSMSGVAMQTEFQLLNARLSEMADNLELAEEQLWELYCLYQATEWTGTIEYPGSFNIQDTQNEFQQLQSAKSAATDPRVLALIDHEIIELLGEDADIIMPEMATLVDGTTVPYDSTEPFEEPEELFNPVTGETQVVNSFAEKRQALTAGWVESEHK